MTTSPVVSITDELIAELEAAANAATPGPWKHATDIGQVGSVDVGDDVLAQAQHLRYGGNSQRNKNAAYIAAANPATILALLAHVADLKQQLAAASVDAERWRCVRDLLHPDDIRDFQLSRVSFGMKPTEDISRQCDVAIDAARNIGSGD